MKFEFFSYDNDSGKSESLDEFAVNFDWTNHPGYGRFIPDIPHERKY